MFFSKLINTFRYYNKRIEIDSTADVSFKCRIEFSDNDFIKIGSKSIIKDFVKIETHYGFVIIGANCSVNSFCYLHGGKHPDSKDGGIVIGDNVRIGAHTSIVAINHKTDRIDIPIRSQGWISKQIVIGDDVWIGANVTILLGVKVGKGAVIAAGSVVIKDVHDYAVIAGNPARTVRVRKA